ncbi:MAG: hypothetical protein SGJ20_06145 [Planctomycetota bacterium]|nr:hypothetical protein [Planctomycetota bacterium]
MEPKLSKQNEILLAHLREGNSLLTAEHYQLLRKALLLQESLGIMSRFIITAAGFVGAVMAILTFWPWSGK